MKFVSRILISLVFILYGVHAVAKEQKIGVVDLQKIMQASSQMKTIQEKLEKDFKPRRDRLVAMEEELKKDIEKFEREKMVMSAKDKKEMEKKIITTRQTFEREGQQYQQELSAAHNEAMEELYNKIRKAINKVATVDQYDLVLQKDVISFSFPKLDITEKVIKEMS